MSLCTALAAGLTVPTSTAQLSDGSLSGHRVANWWSGHGITVGIFDTNPVRKRCLVIIRQRAGNPSILRPVRQGERHDDRCGGADPLLHNGGGVLEKYRTVGLPETPGRRGITSPGNRLEPRAPVTVDPTFDQYQVRYDTGTGTNTRWDTVFGRGNPEFPDRREQDTKLLTYDTTPLLDDTEVTGHPILTLHVSSTRSDGQFFAYLEDVFPDGKVIQITEGCLRAIHRKLSDAKPPYEMAVPYRTYKQADATPLVPGQVSELKFDLLPTSYVFRKSHQVRVSLAGADKDHFRLPEGPPATSSLLPQLRLCIVY